MPGSARPSLSPQARGRELARQGRALWRELGSVNAAAIELMRRHGDVPSIQAHRYVCGLSQDQAAARYNEVTGHLTSLGGTTINAWETWARGRGTGSPPTFSSLLILAEAYGRGPLGVAREELSPGDLVQEAYERLGPEDQLALRGTAAARRAASTPGVGQASGGRGHTSPQVAGSVNAARDHVSVAPSVVRESDRPLAAVQIQRPLDLRPHLTAAFAQPRVRIDFAGFSGETFCEAVNDAVDEVRRGNLQPRSVSLRILIADTSGPLALPAAVRPADGPAVHDRAARTTLRAVERLTETVDELVDLGVVPSASVTVKTYGAASAFKLYVVNESEVFFGFYTAVERTIRLGGEQVPIYDLLGKDVPLFRYAMDGEDDPRASLFVGAARSWFDSVWATVARDVG